MVVTLFRVTRQVGSEEDEFQGRSGDKFLSFNLLMIIVKDKIHNVPTENMNTEWKLS